MDLLNPEARHFILGSLRRSTFLSSLCDCCKDVTIPFKVEKILTIGKEFVAAQCCIINVSGFMQSHFNDISLTGEMCDHERNSDFLVRFSNLQWEAVARHTEHLIATGAKFKSGYLEIPSTKGALMPLQRRRGDEGNSETQHLRVAEMFCGGFSGWSYGLRGMVKRGIRLRHLWAVDRDIDCIKAYSISHQPDVVGFDAEKLWGEIKDSLDRGKEPSTLIHVDIKDKWWLTLFPQKVDILLASPPCPPWVVTNTSPGFNRADGLTFQGMIECIAWVRPCIVVREEVATIMKHEQWPVILALIRWANYRVHACHALNLIDHAPQNRNRCIMILINQTDDPCTDHVFEKWPISQSQSLHTYKAILKEASFWHDTVAISKQEFDLYNNVQLLPKDSTVSGHAKRSARDLQNYRYRSVDQCAACFMTSYGRPCEVDAHLLEKGGLYGSLLQQAGCIRKFATPEIIFLQGAIDRCWISCNIREAMKILGNSISVPHATWGLINAVKMIYPNSFEKSIENLFLDIIGDRMHADNFEFSLHDGGYLFTGKGEQISDDQSDDTQSMMEFACIHVVSPMQSYELICVQDTPIFHAMCCILGASIPQKLELEPKDLVGKRLPLTPDIVTKSSDLTIVTSVPSQLILHEKAFRQHQADVQVVCVLLPERTFVMSRNDSTIIEDVALMLFHHQDYCDSNFVFRDLGGHVLDKSDQCPDAIFAFDRIPASVHDIINKVDIRFDKHHLIFRACTKVEEIEAFLHFVKAQGILDFIRAIGWDFRPITAFQGSSNDSLLLCVPVEGRLSMSSDAFKGVLQSRIFSVVMDGFRSVGPQIWVKLWDTYVWKGSLSPQTEMGVILRAWTIAREIFGEDLEFRMVANGLKISDETCVRDVLLPKQNLIKVHLILSLHGGGKATKAEDLTKAKNSLAAFLLDTGADLADVKTFTEKVMSVAGFVAVQHIVHIKNSDAKMDALGKLSTSLSIPLPAMSKAATQRKNLVKKKLHDGKARQPDIDASNFKLQQGFFRNQDGTECQQIDCLQAGKSGIMLMNPKEAFHWLQNEQNEHCISQDELGMLILGPCPACDTGKCNRIKTPAFDVSGQPVLLSTCLHNLGSQPIVIGEQKTAAEVAVMSTLVFSVTAFKDELDSSKWEELLHTPVKVCFELLSLSGCKLALPWPPWGRSWRNSLGKATPPLADSFQVHIRVPWKDKDDVFKASGINGVYTSPKTEDHQIDPNYAIVWLDGSVADLKVKAATCHDHCGLVKLVKSNGKKISRGIRFPQDQFARYHAILKPGVLVPKQMQCNHFAKLTPTPVGASQEEVQAWLVEVSWEARPIKPLGSKSWLIGAENRFAGTFAMWNDQMLILTWLPPKNRVAEKVILAGAPALISQANKTDSSVPRDEIFEQDPWAQYQSRSSNVANEGLNKGMELDSHKSKNVPVAARAPSGPIEERFKLQDQQIHELKSSIQEMSNRLDQNDGQNEKFKTEVRHELNQVKHEVANQCKSFEDTLHRSLRRQDQQLTEAFGELKALILERPLPSKKAKCTPKNAESDMEDTNEF